jgi:hypothetical protein
MNDPVERALCGVHILDHEKLFVTFKPHCEATSNATVEGLKGSPDDVYRPDVHKRR